MKTVIESNLFFENTIPDSYKTAAKMGSSYAMYRVAQYYEQGLGTRANQHIAQQCKEQALRMEMPKEAIA